MKCENCKKNKANFIYTENINGNKKEIHLCTKCASKLGLDDMSLNFDDFFLDKAGMYSSLFTGNKQKQEIEQAKVCNVCGFTFEDIVKYGKFGCPNCYDTFTLKLDEVFKKMHGKNRHTGKKPSFNFEIADNIKIEELEKQLKESIQVENYEEAAKIRDEIKRLKENIKKEDK